MSFPENAITHQIDVGAVGTVVAARKLPKTKIV
jgi:hypothetical protein